jgi:hypothetical protein
VRDKPGLEYFLNGKNAASIAQLRIDNHQVWSELSSGRDSAGLGGLDCADDMTHLRKHFAKEQAVQGVVLNQKDAERFHCPTSTAAATSSPAPISRRSSRAGAVQRSLQRSDERIAS